LNITIIVEKKVKFKHWCHRKIDLNKAGQNNNFSSVLFMFEIKFKEFITFKWGLIWRRNIKRHFNKLDETFYCKKYVLKLLVA
jgi:hypothetical protein